MKNADRLPDTLPATGEDRVILKKWLEGLLATAFLYLLIVIFFRDLVFGGEVFAASGDSIPASTFEGWGRELMARGIFPLWNPYIFSGMPSFGSLQFAPGAYPALWLLPLYKILFLGSSSVHILIHHLLGGLFAYLLLRDLEMDTPLALFGAVIFFFSPQEIILGPAAHGGKLFTIAYLPLILLLTRRYLRHPAILTSSLLALAIGIQLLALHMQIAYYGLLMVGIYFVVDAIQHRKQRNLREHLIRSCGLAAIGLLALFLSAYLLWPVYEYSQFSIRGGGAVGGGVSFDYATNWSFHPKEMLTFLVPSWFGFGMPTYWGYMPFTEHPYYMGLVPLLLAAVAVILRRRKKVVQVLLVIGIFSLLVSFGKWFSILFYPLYKVLPFFAKFRVPAMILILVLLVVAILATVGFKALLDLKGEQRRKWTKVMRLATISLGVLFLIVLAGKVAFRDAYTATAAARIGPAAAWEAYLLFWGDALRVIGCAALAALFLYLYMRDILNSRITVAIIALLVIADLWTVNARLVTTTPQANRPEVAPPIPHAEFLVQQEGPFRLVNLDLRVPGNYWMSHGLEDIEGYSPAKLKYYQQLIESQPGGRMQMPNLLAMLNVRYVIYSDTIALEEFKPVYSYGEMNIFEYTGALGPAWLVGEVSRAESDEQVLGALMQGFDTSTRALTTEEIGSVDPVAASAGRVVLEERDVHHLRYTVTTEGSVLLVLSEVYYPAGWQAEVDGVTVPIHRVNHVLRAVRINGEGGGSGIHTVELFFRPRSVHSGRVLSLGALVLLFSGLMAGVLQRRRELAAES